MLKKIDIENKLQIAMMDKYNVLTYMGEKSKQQQCDIGSIQELYCLLDFLHKYHEIELCSALIELKQGIFQINNRVLCVLDVGIDELSTYTFWTTGMFRQNLSELSKKQGYFIFSFDLSGSQEILVPGCYVYFSVEHHIKRTIPISYMTSLELHYDVSFDVVKDALQQLKSNFGVPVNPHVTTSNGTDCVIQKI